MLIVLESFGLAQQARARPEGGASPNGRGCFLIGGLVGWINFGPLRKFPLSHEIPLRYKNPKTQTFRLRCVFISFLYGLCTCKVFTIKFLPLKKHSEGEIF